MHMYIVIYFCILNFQYFIDANISTVEIVFFPPRPLDAKKI